MSHCPRCKNAIRRDESLSRVQALDGWYSACPRCVAELTGTPEPPTRTYPQGQPIPREPGSDGDMRICGLCRRALYYDDQNTAMRVPENARGIEPGVYAACRECLEEWRPAIRDRLASGDIIPADFPPQLIAGNLLL